MNNIEELKRKLNSINYNQNTVPFSEEINDKWTLGKYTLSGCIVTDIQTIRKKLEEKNINIDYHIGVISAGTHTVDYQNVFEFKPDNDWHTEPVMFVYECPASNLDVSFYGSYDKDKNDPSLPKEEDLLCSHLWRINPFKKECNDYDYFGQKKYDEFIYSVIKTFKLANLYTTNLFRYEIYKIENEKEKALNLPQIMQELSNDTICTEVFKKEIEIHQPKVIFATSNPYNWIKNNWDKLGYNDGNKPKIVKVPHPANRDNSKVRFLKNAFEINSGLKKAGIIDEKTEKDNLNTIYDNYKEIKD